MGSVSNLDRRRTLAEAYDNAARIIAGISPDQTSHRTPCAEYDVSELVDHLVEAGRRAAALGHGQAPPPGDASVHVPLDEAADAVRMSARVATEAWADDSCLSATQTMPWGVDYPGSTLLDMYIVELAVHAWDLAAATGQSDRLSPRLAQPALDAARGWLLPEFRNLVAPGSPYASEIEVGSQAADWDQLVAFMGRDPSRWCFDR